MKLNTVFTYFLACIGLAFVVLMFKITYPYFSFRYDIDFLLTKQTLLHLTTWRWAFYLHISSSLLVFFAGIIQFIPSVLANFPKLHRQLGKVYVFLVLFISAPSGLIMGYYANGGFWAKLSFVILSTLWWAFTFLAYRFIIKGNLEMHRAFMYRSFALTLSAISLRTYVLVLPYFIHLRGREMYVLVAWMSWIPNLLVAEWLIRKLVFGKDKLVRKFN
jgi:uncharacterized membrane protein